MQPEETKDKGNVGIHKFNKFYTKKKIVGVFSKIRKSEFEETQYLLLKSGENIRSCYMNMTDSCELKEK